MPMTTKKECVSCGLRKDISEFEDVLLEKNNAFNVIESKIKLSEPSCSEYLIILSSL